MRRSGGDLWLKIVVMAAMLTFAVCRDPVRHLVGGNDRWKPNVNYTDWSLQQVFYVGDWLYFVYDRNLFNVLEVNETSYGNCSDQGFIFNITRGAGRDVFELTQPKQYYFLSSGGYCYNGMKVSVNVVEFVPAPVPSPPQSGSYMIKGINPLVLLIVIVVWAV
ncbi:putative Phytocyanin domain, cupredoxin [Helianthus annuus]|uniref:Phytocyanin domain, cupredoxin n=1 Tax=Helianthus annuus TaxID=4232 RepID=A0A251SEL5_HELAN|nr:lamin-like protein [Helianthus annuus]KAF5766063.1 putative Phytocyanin domain, cupredoxin [Helianthus annuus]KAJ0452506.1 putative Phytocyanin domain, cupredoxin [Helianthus annuus]KAJ0457427.1 putative Phytocyanin domain, cupredoxin [Helianthus annuus]KAJ0474407.1 putative Phytocyanin domain, cupredoxin [Helianthus annuus]KAJ0649971.1 putative Phytocyanin domain, cupredoxin [Helianthus annuus]